MPMLSTEYSNPWLDQSIVDVLEVPSEKIHHDTVISCQAATNGLGDGRAVR